MSARRVRRYLRRAMRAEQRAERAHQDALWWARIARIEADLDRLVDVTLRDRP